MIKIIVILSLVINLVSCGQQSPQSQLGGDFRTADISDWFQYYIYQPDVGEIAERIQAVIRVEDSDISSEKLARMIKIVSQCYRIDTFYFTGMIQMESWFNPKARSPTNAVGLTQFTNIGIREVNDQLGRRGTRYARVFATRYHSRIINQCIMPQVEQHWQPLWESPEMTIKESLVAKPLYALIYGAILLKTNLAVAKKLHGDQNKSLSAKALFETALTRYNGDPSLEVRERYVSRIGRYAQNFHRNH